MAKEDDIRRQRIIDIEAELEGRTRKTKAYIKLEKEVIDLKEKEKKVQEDINKGLDLGVKANKAFAKISADATKAEEALSKSFSERLQSLVKGNVAQAIGLDGSRKSKILTRDLAKETKTQAEFILNDSKASAANKLKLLSITEDVASGVSSEAEAHERVKSLGLTQSGLSKKMQKRVSGIASKQKEASLHVGKSSARMAKFAKFGGLAGIAIGLIAKAVSGFSEKIDSVGQTFGFLTNKSPDLRNDLIDTGNEAMMIGKSLQDVLGVTSQLSSEFGLTLKESKDIAGSVLDTAVATGISNDEATKLFGTFMQIGGLTAKQSERLIENTAQLAAQKGVAPVAVLQDMAGSAEEIAGFTKDGGKNIAEAAVQARQMGLSLSTTAKIADGLLDFESSIANEMEASIMIGKQLNFQKARQLALEGDIAGATKNIVDQVGSEADFNALNVLQRRSLAKSIGVSVNEMAKLVRGSEKLTLSGAMAGKNFDDIVGQDSLSTLTSIINTIKSVGASLLDSFGKPIAEVMEKFKKFVSGPDGIKNIKTQLIKLANVFVDIFNTGRQFLNTFRFDVEDAKKFEMDASGNISQTKVNDFKSGPGQITHMMGPAGMFSLNPRDSVMGTTNRVNDFQTGPAGSMGGMDAVAFGKAVAANIHLETKTTHGQQRIIMNSAINPYGGHSMNPGK